MSLQWDRQTETVAAGDRDGSFPIRLFWVAPNFQTLVSPYDDWDLPSKGGKLVLGCQIVAWNIWSEGVCSHLLSLLSTTGKKALQTAYREEIILLKSYLFTECEPQVKSP